MALFVDDMIPAVCLAWCKLGGCYTTATDRGYAVVSLLGTICLHLVTVPRHVTTIHYGAELRNRSSVAVTLPDIGGTHYGVTATASVRSVHTHRQTDSTVPRRLDIAIRINKKTQVQVFGSTGVYWSLRYLAQNTGPLGRCITHWSSSCSSRNPPDRSDNMGFPLQSTKHGVVCLHIKELGRMVYIVM